MADRYEEEFNWIMQQTFNDKNEIVSVKVYFKVCAGCYSYASGRIPYVDESGEYMKEKPSKKWLTKDELCQICTELGFEKGWKGDTTQTVSEMRRSAQFGDIKRLERLREKEKKSSNLQKNEDSMIQESEGFWEKNV